MPFKLALVEQYGIENGFLIYRSMLNLPPSFSISPQRVAGRYDFAKEHALRFEEIYPAGEPFHIPPTSVVGPSDCRPLVGRTRSFFVACLENAAIANHSTFITAGGLPLLDFQGTERSEVGDYLELDRFVFHADGDIAWMISEGEPVTEIDEAFVSLVGPHCMHFGHWLWEFLPKYLTALDSGALPPVPLVIDERLGPTLRAALLLLKSPEAEIIELPAFTRARVRRLWCAPTLSYQPIWPRPRAMQNGPDTGCVPPARFRPTLAAMQALASSIQSGTSPATRIYLARRPGLQRQLTNHHVIEAIVQSLGFVIFYPEDYSFQDQVSIVRGARYVVGPDGSAAFLAFFGQPGSKMCLLSHTFTLEALMLTCLLKDAGIDTTIFTGPLLRSNDAPGPPNFGDRQHADYEIDELAFSQFMGAWLD
jgi:capsular polysaccharide biosynthesis protein